MQQHIYYTKYALQFADMQITELVTSFNQEVKNPGWSSMRAYHDQALIDEFQRRDVDVSSIHVGHTTDFNHHVKYNLFANRLETID